MFLSKSQYDTSQSLILGEVLATIDTLLVYNNYATVSPCGSLVAASGITHYSSYYYFLLPERRFKNEAIQNPATPIG